MLIIALVLALIGLVALVFAVVTSNQLVAWVCIGASALGVVLLIVDALRERQQREAASKDQDEAEQPADADGEADYVEYPDDDAEAEPAAEDVEDAEEGSEDTEGPEDTEGQEDADTAEESTVSADAKRDDSAE
ncbi:hypothetical protein MM1218R_03189 [Mycobacterium marinum]|uniref:Conserved hypothetical membrane protein n=1 Tax=Mycobacterium marinum (strain ATCC BAA-535 / M) TaxID=216594 RepID=B2HGQ7_MYCMM|nr:membrane protein [Mycobacterium marinum]ACC41610.1 conserved hypothetical membrane protein [Mycobacterium marinum M]AXN45124.1 hypothetical protein MM1218R_03189 [Mycobacterium marinum]AXN50465.1 hypothetical protein CCUG20998_03061 [Mycobacterium marinum]EPQ80861.1 hypothetical protein MMEU_1386 [Mycobacterium marinum str. Europe]RFZ01672.1 hypothetical protein DE4381_05366 [Mycobacterium marinum]